MSTRQTKIVDATDEQLLAFARDALGLSIHPQSKRETILAKMAPAWTNDYITVAKEKEAPEPVAAPAAEIAATTAGQPKVTVLIAVGTERGDDRPIPLGVNGRIMLVKRGEPQQIPAAYFYVLQEAVQHIYDPMPDGGLNPEPRRVPAYPYSVMEGYREFQAWLAAQRQPKAA